MPGRPIAIKPKSKAARVVVRYLRDGRKLGALASDVGCHVDTLRHYLKGEQRPSLEIAQALEKRTGAKMGDW